MSIPKLARHGENFKPEYASAAPNGESLAGQSRNVSINLKHLA